MGLDVTASGLCKEITAYSAKMKTVVDSWPARIKEYASPAYLGQRGAPEPENYKFTFMMHAQAREMSGDTQVRFSTRRKVADERVETLEMACDRWQHDTRFDALRERMLADVHLYDFGVVMVAQRPRRGFEQNDDPVMTPIGVRIPPTMFGCDAVAGDIDSARLIWHVVLRDKDEFVKEAKKEDGWRMEAVAELTTDQRTEELRQQQKGVSIKRDEVAYCEVWCGGHTLPDNDPFWQGMNKRERSRYHGTIFTVPWVAPGDAEYLRDPRPYFGPREGPYAVGGIMVVPEEWRGLAPLTAGQGQIDQVNAQARANDKSAMQRKSLYLVNAFTADAMASVIASSDGEIIAVPGLKDTPGIMVEIGGITEEARVREMELRARTERNLAFGDQAQGIVTGTATATENDIAARAVANIAGLMDRKFAAYKAEVFRRVAWYFDQDFRTGVRYDGVTVLGGSGNEEKIKAITLALQNELIDQEEAEMAAGMLQPGDDHPGSFDDLEIHIDSTRKDGSEEQRLTLINNSLLQWAPLLPQVAGYASEGLKAFFERQADALDYPELRNPFDFEAAAKIGEMMMQAAAAEPPQTLPPAKPDAQTKPPGAGPPKPKPKGPPKK